MTVDVELDASAVRAAFAALRGRLDDLPQAWDQVGARMENAAAPVTPVLSGALVDSLVAQPEGDGVTFGSDLIYAGVQDRGWPAHNISGHHFMQQAEDEARSAVVDELEPAIQQVIDRLGLH